LQGSEGYCFFRGGVKLVAQLEVAAGGHTSPQLVQVALVYNVVSIPSPDTLAVAHRFQGLAMGLQEFP
jgi:hypothetical protein